MNSKEKAPQPGFRTAIRALHEKIQDAMTAAKAAAGKDKNPAKIERPWETRVNGNIQR